MSATRPRRGIRAKTIPADLMRIDTLSSRDDVNVGEGRTAFLLDRERESPGADQTPEGHASTGERLADDVHDLHHVHAPNDGDLLAAATDPGAEALVAAIQVV